MVELRWWLSAGLLLIVVVIAYAPALRGGLLWDDDAHVTRPELRSWHGLYRIWFEPGATQQYYPLLHSAFWLQHRLWGESTLGYHLVNLMLHYGAALLVGLILRRLAVPGAFLAAAIFALHPVHVESVAWISELKNTLSAVFYLSAMLCYLRFDEHRRRLWYGVALGLFILGLLSKTVTATLPAALLVIFWWQRGRLSWRRDVLPLAPFFLLGAAGGLFTAWAERALVGADGAEYEFTLIERFLVAGRVVWFYLGKLVWPANLTFIYPSWEINQREWWQYLFPLGALGLLTGLWLCRKRSRAPLAAVLFFGGTLFPVLGFFNVYPFRYSFVADHFQYLASLGIISLFAAGIVSLVARWRFTAGLPLVVVGCVIAGLLATLTWRQSRQYADIETLYRETIRRNPTCWLAYNNWGNTLNALGRPQEAILFFQQGWRIKPDYADIHNNWGNSLQALGRPKEAIEYYRQALRINPAYAQAHNNWGSALQALGHHQEAILHYQLALRIKPNSADALNNWANALNALGLPHEAVLRCREALWIRPDYAEAHNNYANALNALARPGEAIEHCQEAVRLQPEFVEAHINWGNALLALQRPQEALEHYQEALRLREDIAEAHNNLGNALSALGRPTEAISHYEAALRIAPNYAEAHVNWGIALTHQGQLEVAVAHFNKALLLKPHFPPALANLRLVEQLRQKSPPIGKSPE